MDFLSLLKQQYPNTMAVLTGESSHAKTSKGDKPKSKSKGIINEEDLKGLIKAWMNDATYLEQQMRSGGTPPTYPLDTYPGSLHPKVS